MNHRLIATVLGYTLCVEGFFLLLPAPVCVYFGEGDWRAFLAAASSSGAHSRSGWAAWAFWCCFWR